jgi:hypothetical protein
VARERAFQEVGFETSTRLTSSPAVDEELVGLVSHLQPDFVVIVHSFARLPAKQRCLASLMRKLNAR